MTVKDVNRRILNILIPAIMENALLLASGMILTAYIGRLRVEDISAYGLANNIYNVYFSLFKGFSIGIILLLAKAFGRQDRLLCAKLQKIAYMTILPMAVFGAIIIGLFSDGFLGLLTDSAELKGLGTEFMRISVFSYPMISVVHVNTAAFQANGNTRTPLVIALFGNAVTIVLGYFLIGSFGLAGAAVVQIISNFLMCCAGFCFLYGRNGLLPIRSEKVSLADIAYSKQMLGAGIPTAAENSFWSLSMIFISTVILSYGNEYYAAFQLGLQGESFCEMMSAGFLTAAISLSANAVGAGNSSLFKICYRRLSHYCNVISVITMLFLLFFSETTLSFLTDKTDLIRIGTVYLQTMIFSQYPSHKQKIVFGYLRSCGYVKTPMIITAIGIWAVRVGMIFLFGVILHADIVVIWWIFNADQWIRELLAEGLFRQKNILHCLDDRNECKMLHTVR